MSNVIPERRSAPLLFDVLPDLGRRVSWTPLAHVPTPVEPCDALAGWLGRGGVFMKRDDLVSPLYGGNKVRRYEMVLGDAKAKGARRIVTAGGIASTQVMATALFGKALGFEVSAVLFDQPVTDFAKASLLGFADAGVEIVHGGGYAMTALRALRAYRRVPGSYFIMPGASDPMANIGYVDAMLELGAQVERGEAPRPDVIVVPAGSSGTLAALALGAAYLGWRTEIVGVRITTALACNRLTVKWIIRGTDRFLARDPRWRSMRDRVRFSIFGAELGRGYGYPTDAAREAAERWADITGVRGEVTYSGKALAAVRALCRDSRRRDQTILLWNTLSTNRPTPGAEVRARLPRSLDRVLDTPSLA
ncbi:pyridoxal phosphate-dependent deaminase, putative [Minicystis rosea]|nr:pyridoxal phosphate-dependent deaminase, putative [Minicystis rosea]